MPNRANDDESNEMAISRGRHNWMAIVINRCWAMVHALGVALNYLVTLEALDYAAEVLLDRKGALSLACFRTHLSYPGADKETDRVKDIAGFVSLRLSGRRTDQHKI